MDSILNHSWLTLFLHRFLFLHGFVECRKQARSAQDMEIQKQMKSLNKPAVKTFHTEYGDIFDCVNIYEQPAFDHPLLKNHTIQMEPTSLSKSSGENNGLESISSNASSRIDPIECPEGTVPIRRVTKEATSFYGWKSSTSVGGCPTPNYHAGVGTVMNTYYGGVAYYNIWSPTVANDGGYTDAQLYVANDDNIIRAGWMVNPTLFGDSRPRMFVGWTVDFNENTGCFNTMCPGFVVTGKYAPGSAFSSVSSYGGQQWGIDFQIFRDPVMHNWWLVLSKGEIRVGYWPKEVVPKLAYDAATFIQWGGDLCVTKDLSPGNEMGSGLFPYEKFGKAAYVRNMQYVMEENAGFVDPERNRIIASADNPSCFDVSDKDYASDWGWYVYYGGAPNLDFDCRTGPPISQKN